MEQIFIGIDPGANGAAAALNQFGEIFDVIRFKDATPRDICDCIDEWIYPENDSNCVAVIEQVSAMPKQGVASTFKFGRSFGMLEGILYAKQIPFTYARPQLWQKQMKCLTKGDKNITKSAAQRLYPDRKITHADADAILIARYCYDVNK